MKPRTIEMEFPLPPKACHPNARSHWAAKAKATKAHRATCAGLARLRMTGEPFSSAGLHMTFYVARRQDQDNLISWTKALRDGLQDAGVIVNDAGFTIHPPKQITGKDSRGYRGIQLTVIEIVGVPASA